MCHNLWDSEPILDPLWLLLRNTYLVYVVKELKEISVVIQFGLAENFFYVSQFLVFLLIFSRGIDAFFGNLLETLIELPFGSYILRVQILQSSELRPILAAALVSLQRLLRHPVRTVVRTGN